MILLIHLFRYSIRFILLHKFTVLPEVMLLLDL